MNARTSGLTMIPLASPSAVEALDAIELVRTSDGMSKWRLNERSGAHLGHCVGKERLLRYQLMREEPNERPPERVSLDVA